MFCNSKKFYFLAFSLLWLLFLPSSLEGQSISFEHSFIIGKEESDSTEYLFSGPKAITSDTNGRVYIADGSSNTIRIFDQKGNFITSIGKRGRGPGEFLNIEHLEMDKNNNLYILDRVSRRVTVFNKTLNDHETFALHADFTDPFAIYPFSKDENLILATGVTSSKANLGYLFDKEFNKIIKRFFPINPILFEEHDDFYNAIGNNPDYNTTKFGNGSVAVCHSSFTGKIALINSINKNIDEIGTWNADNYEILEWDKRRQYLNSNIRGLVFSSNQGGGFVYKEKLASKALLGNKEFLIHFFTLLKDNRRISKVNVYNKKGQFLLTQNLENTSLDLYKEDGVIVLYPLHLDNQNQIYFADYTKGMGFPVVRVVTMKVKE